MNLPHIFLIGFMGSGKSYVGKRLAQLLERDFLDLDDYIERKAGATISELFTQQGEAQFRQLESDSLREMTRFAPCVISSGGGTPCQHSNMEWMNENGTTIFLDAAPDILVNRLQKEFTHRPLLAQEPDLADFIIKKLESRRPFYEQAQHQLKIEEEGLAVERIILQYLLA